MPMSFTQRVRIPELMDNPNLDAAAHQAALRGLARLNRISDSAGVIWPCLRNHDWSKLGRPVRILDIATGAGDLPIQLSRKANKQNFPLEIEGCDISDTAVSHATGQAEAAGVAVRFFQHNVLRDPLPDRYDVVMCSLFLHHLADEEAQLLLERMREATDRLLLVNDLLRSRLNYWLVWLASRLVTRSPVVHFDGPVSVRAAFTLAEVRELALRAGLTNATVEARPPCRLLLAWSRV